VKSHDQRNETARFEGPILEEPNFSDQTYVESSHLLFGETLQKFTTVPNQVEEDLKNQEGRIHASAKHVPGRVEKGKEFADFR